MGSRRHHILFTKCLKGLAIGGGEHDCHGHAQVSVIEPSVPMVSTPVFELGF
jgi:hypothetical protein